MTNTIIANETIIAIDNFYEIVCEIKKCKDEIVYSTSYISGWSFTFKGVDFFKYVDSVEKEFYDAQTEEPRYLIFALDILDLEEVTSNKLGMLKIMLDNIINLKRNKDRLTKLESLLVKKDLFKSLVNQYIKPKIDEEYCKFFEINFTNEYGYIS